MQRDVVFRGTRDGLLVVLSDGPDFSQLLDTLERRLEETGGFFRGASVTAAVLGRRLTPEQRSRLIHLLEDRFGMVLRQIREGESAAAVLGRGPGEPGRAARSPGGGPGGEGRRPEGKEWEWAVPAPRAEPPLVLARTLRSGQAVYHRGDVVILGDVNPGAEVVATGHIVVMGALRGVAHAGAGGDETAVVAALRLEPTQLRIGSRVGRAPDDPVREAPGVPEVARVVDGQIVIEGRR